MYVWSAINWRAYLCTQTLAICVQHYNIMYMYKVINIPINWISTKLKVSKGSHKNTMGLYYMYFCLSYGMLVMVHIIIIVIAFVITDFYATQHYTGESP